MQPSMTLSAWRSLGGALGWPAANRAGRTRSPNKVREDRETASVVGQLIAVLPVELADQPMQAQPSQVIAHLIGAVGGAEQSGEVGAKARRWKSR